MFVIAAALEAVLVSGASAYSPDDVICDVVLEASSELSMSDYQSSEILLGKLTADALRESTGAEIAIVCAGELSPAMGYGSLTWEQLQQQYPLNGEIATAEVTAGQLYEILENGVSHVTLTDDLKIDHDASAFDGFPQISGFTFSYDVSAPAGERVYELTLDDGTEISRDSEGTFLLAGTTDLFEGSWGMPALENSPEGKPLSEAAAEYLSAMGEIDKAPDDREHVRGAANEEPLIHGALPIAALAVAAVFFGFAGTSKYKNLLNFRMDAGHAESRKK